MKIIIEYIFWQGKLYTIIRTAYEAAYEALAGNALFYYNPKISTSKWVQSRTKTVKIGNHIFAK